MAKPQFILAVDTIPYFVNTDAITKENYSSFIAKMQYFLTIKQRDNLDGIGESGFSDCTMDLKDVIKTQLIQGNAKFRQLLPYTVFRLKGTNVFATYRRTKLVGESRLSGNSSIGFGGHIDLIDAAFDEKSIINLPQTIFTSAEREIKEEVKTTGLLSTMFFKKYSEADFYVLTDNSDEVGLLHLGLVKIIDVEESEILGINEKELEWLGFKTSEEILELNPESWTKIILSNI